LPLLFYGIDFKEKVYYTGNTRKECPMSEQRKSKRRKIMAFTPVYNQARTILYGYIGDLTMMGALVIGEKQLEVGTESVFVIDFPETPEFSARKMRVMAKVIWDKWDPDKQSYRSGIEFQNISETNKTILESLLARYIYHHV
jgi:Tfp pilus assembly protein PilZ